MFEYIFGGLGMECFGIFMAISNILVPFGIFGYFWYILWVFWYFFPALICCTKKHLATLICTRAFSQISIFDFFPDPATKVQQLLNQQKTGSLDNRPRQLNGHSQGLDVMKIHFRPKTFPDKFAPSNFGLISYNLQISEYCILRHFEAI
jgi:hypothetical protein